MIPHFYIPRVLINIYLLTGISYLGVRNFSKFEFSPPPDDPCVLDPMPCVLKYVAGERLEEEKPEKNPENEEVWRKDWTFQRQPQELSLCPAIPPGLNGAVEINLNPINLSVTEKKYSMLLPGGRWSPKECRSRHRVAIIIPFRDREVHLKVLLNNLHSFLQKQQLDYSVIVVEQTAKQRMNKAKLMDVAYTEAKKLYPFECFIFHDVDLVPEDDRNLYSCPVNPRHMSVAIDKFDYALPYNELFGGVVAVTPEQFETVNGYSTDYWGWGGEDDDMTNRVLLAGYKIARYPGHIARYKMLKHRKDKGNPLNSCATKFLKLTKERWQKHGLHQLENYKIVKKEFLPLYTHFLVDLMENESRKALNNDVLC